MTNDSITVLNRFLEPFCSMEAIGIYLSDNISPPCEVVWNPATLRNTIKLLKHEEELTTFCNVQIVCICLSSSQRRLGNAYDQWVFFCFWRNVLGNNYQVFVFCSFYLSFCSLGNKSQQWILPTFPWATDYTEFVFITYMDVLFPLNFFKYITLVWMMFKPSKFQRSLYPSLIICFGKTNYWVCN